MPSNFITQHAEEAPSPSFSGPLDDPFKTWANSDLLIHEYDQAFFARQYPAYAPIFDWPEIRSLFVEYDRAAAGARRYSRRAGVIAVMMGFASLVVAASVPLTDELTKATVPPLHTQAALGGVAAFFAIVSMLIGYTQILKGKSKTRWLTNRFWTERIRQFHFQLMVNHLPRLVEAAQSTDGLKAWLEFRAQQLDRFTHDYLRGAEDKMHHLEADEAEDSPWIFEEWNDASVAPEPCAEVDQLFYLLGQQRFGIQQRYAERKLFNGWYSPEFRSQWIGSLSDGLTAVLLLATITVGVGSVIAFNGSSSPTFRLIGGIVAAVASSSIVAMRALKEGLLIRADAERYKWYLATVRTLRRRWEQSDPRRKVYLLREMERVSYQEMRRFILSGTQARFVM